MIYCLKIFVYSSENLRSAIVFKILENNQNGDLVILFILLNILIFILF
jgi:hypothetical protein